MNRWSARLRREAGSASLQSALVVAVGAFVVVGVWGLWTGTIRGAVRAAAAAHLAPTEAGATRPPAATYPPEADGPDADGPPAPLPARDELARRDRGTARAGAGREPGDPAADHAPHVPDRVRRYDDDARRRLTGRGEDQARTGRRPTRPEVLPE